MVGYADTPLYKKLGLKKEFKAVALNAPNYYRELIEEHKDEVPDFEYVLFGKVDFIHAFFESSEKLHKDFSRLKKCLKPAGILWISWPKKAKKVATVPALEKGGSQSKSDLDENIIREIGLKNGLVDVKVCAIDEKWSGLKFVYRLKDR
jgi:hypothetical protein